MGIFTQYQFLTKSICFFIGMYLIQKKKITEDA